MICCNKTILVGVLTTTLATPLVAAAPLTISRASLAKTASFTVTSTIAPKGGSKTTQTFRVEVKNAKARMDFENPQIGAASYLVNEKGVFLYIPSNKFAQKTNLSIDSALRFAFSQANEQLRTAKKTGVASVSGQPTDVYTDPKKGVTLYIGKSAGFRLPVKTVQSNEGGTRTVLVSNIKLNAPIADGRFAIPKGTQVLESSGAAGAPGIPGFGG